MGDPQGQARQAGPFWRILPLRNHDVGSFLNDNRDLNRYSTQAEDEVLTFLLIAAGLAALVVGAEALVRGASKLALSFGISPLVVGLTVVAFGTSSPEVAVSVDAVLDGKGDLALGNVVGSNIFNILLILGISALITPLLVAEQLIRQEVPIMIGSFAAPVRAGPRPPDRSRRGSAAHRSAGGVYGVSDSPESQCQPCTA
jgi:hypothetical protein